MRCLLLQGMVVLDGAAVLGTGDEVATAAVTHAFLSLISLQIVEPWMGAPLARSEALRVGSLMELT